MNQLIDDPDSVLDHPDDDVVIEARTAEDLAEDSRLLEEYVLDDEEAEENRAKLFRNRLQEILDYEEATEADDPRNYYSNPAILVAASAAFDAVLDNGYTTH